MSRRKFRRMKPLSERKKPKGKDFADLIYFKGSFIDAEKPYFWRKAKEIFMELNSPLKDAKKFKLNLLSAINTLKFEDKPRVNVQVETSKGIIYLQVIKSKEGRLMVRQQPLTHGVGIPAKEQKLTSFDALLRILKSDFVGEGFPFPTNVVIHTKRRELSYATTMPYDKKITSGDSYAIETMAFADSKFRPRKVRGSETTETQAFVRKGLPTQIVRINIELYVDLRLDPAEDKLRIKKILERKKAFYRKKLKGWPVYFRQRQIGRLRMPKFL